MKGSKTADPYCARCEVYHGSDYECISDTEIKELEGPVWWTPRWLYGRRATRNKQNEPMGGLHSQEHVYRPCDRYTLHGDGQPHPCPNHALTEGEECPFVHVDSEGK